MENAFITIYIRKNPMETARNLLSLAIDSSIGDLAALECLIGPLVSKGEISTGMVCTLLDSTKACLLAWYLSKTSTMYMN